MQPICRAVENAMRGSNSICVFFCFASLRSSFDERIRQFSRSLLCLFTVFVVIVAIAGVLHKNAYNLIGRTFVAKEFDAQFGNLAKRINRTRSVCHLV